MIQLTGDYLCVLVLHWYLRAFLIARHGSLLANICVRLGETNRKLANEIQCEIGSTGSRITT